MLKHQFQRNVFEEQVFRRTQDGGQALLFLFGHERGNRFWGDSLAQAHPGGRPFNMLYLRSDSAGTHSFARHANERDPGRC